jgi:nucleotide-binding universal stress UspA family protein
MGSIQRSEESQMNANKNIFVAVDDSEASDRAVTYVAQMVDGRKEFHILLFHVPTSMPPQLLEFGGAEVPAQEERAEVELSNAQAAWVEDVARAAQPIFARAKTRLREAHIAEQDVKTLLFTPSAEQSLETSILTAARAHDCSTVVVGREAFSWLREFFQAHVADKLLPQAGGLTLWIVQ